MQKSIWMIHMITISRIKPFIFLTAVILIGCQDNTVEQNLQPISDHAKTNTALSDDPKMHAKTLMSLKVYSMNLTQVTLKRYKALN